MTESDMVLAIRQAISPVARLAQLQEEAAELAQACSKLLRIMDGTNPTPVTEEEAWENLHEEFDDVMNAAQVAGIRGSKLRQWCKKVRWYERIEEAKKHAAN